MIGPSRRLVATLAALIVLSACGPNTPVPIEVPSDLLPSQPLAADPEIARAIEFRLSMGLRADEAWVRRVAADPTATTEFGVPLLPIETEELFSRGAGAEEVAVIVGEYAARHPDAVGGFFIDNAAGGDFVVLLVGDVATHEAEIRKMLSPTADVVFRAVRFSEAQLRELQDRIVRDEGWLRSIGAPMRSAGLDTMGNRVTLEVSSADPEAPALILAHFGVPAEMLSITIDGTGIATKPGGRIEGRAVDASGAPVAGLDVRYVPDIDIGPRGDIGIGTAEDGTFVLERMPPTGYTIELYRQGANDEAVLVGSGRVSVPAGGVATLEIVVAGG